MTRREARITAMELLFETDFHTTKEQAEETYSRAKDARGFADDEYAKDLYFGVCSHRDEIDKIIADNASGWSLDRISHVSHAVMSISIYEMLYRQDVPVKVSLNEAVEIIKIYDDEKAAPFVNGILNTVKDNLNKLSHAE